MARRSPGSPDLVCELADLVAEPAAGLLEHAARDRKKLCMQASDCFVVNVWGAGYRLY